GRPLIDGRAGLILTAGIGDIGAAAGEAEVGFGRGPNTDTAVQFHILVAWNLVPELVETQFGIGLPEQLLDLLLEIAVLALADMHVSDVTVLIDQVIGRPGLVVEGVPDLVVAIDRDRKIETEALGGVGDQFGILGE